MLTLLQRLQAVIDRVTAGLNVLGTVLILALMVLINADVVGRGLFLSPVSGVPELVSMSIVAIVFLQVGQAFRMGRFTRTDALINGLQRRVPRVRALLEFVYCAAGFFIIAVLLQASYPLFIKAWDRNTFVGTVGDFIAPIWPVKLVILIGCTALMLQLAMSAVRAAILVYSGQNGDADKTESGHDAV
ncbi:TRAP transporter small permease subunit [Hoeflea prorocentri]|uniref:TRAP transporter small permease protein n=1 Tax=Hoeflea prorocentri TaxID=1922333 RepID=A0A9X3UNU4_9HYPH|nr:TRAP transporter small permease subunit [Hoeflea prorocentri]MCY6382669.1 TRAP transporter small permease subunit [Hoeflea prorocentri]MDA5400469.1 TRAP transporter small permease subunit [Hoeflea prorocentri]